MFTFKIKKTSHTQIYILHMGGNVIGRTICNSCGVWEFSHFWEGLGALSKDVKDISLSELNTIIPLKKLLLLIEDHA